MRGTVGAEGGRGRGGGGAARLVPMSDPQPPRLAFLGAAGTVTGSRHLVEVGGRAVLFDCGLFQGLKALRRMNWQPFPYEAGRIAGVVLSHAHLDHSGWLPRLVKEGFRGPIWCTPPTRDLLRLLLLDAAAIQEEEAAHANRHRWSRHDPALPLFTREDAERALDRVEVVRFDHLEEPFPGLSFRYARAGHILGAALVEAWLGSGSGQVKLVFTGDLGRYGLPILRDPVTVAEADHLLLESTYGDRDHGAEDPGDALAREVRAAAARGGMLLIPAFAVGRTQEVLWHLRELEEQRRIPKLPVFLDSPMARAATQAYAAHASEHDDEMRLAARWGEPLSTARFDVVETRDESRRINGMKGPAIVVAGSGMATGGRILHHLRQRLPDPSCTVLFVGYQAAGTRGRLLVDGAAEVKMLGEVVPVRARIARISSFSAHADASGLLRWLGGFVRPPRTTWLVHGEPEASRALRIRIERELGWRVRVPDLGDSVELDGIVAEAEPAAPGRGAG